MNTVDHISVAYGFQKSINGIDAEEEKQPPLQADTHTKAYTVDMGGGKSSVCTYQEQSPTLACTHYGEPAVAYTLKTRGGLYHTLNSDSRNYVVIPIAVLGGGREHSTICMDETAPTLCTFQDSKPILIARLDNAEIL